MTTKKPKSKSKYKKSKKEEYLTVHVKPAIKAKYTVQVTVPHEFFLAEALGDVVKQAIHAVQKKWAEIDGAH